MFRIDYFWRILRWLSERKDLSPWGYYRKWNRNNSLQNLFRLSFLNLLYLPLRFQLGVRRPCHKYIWKYSVLRSKPSRDIWFGYLISERFERTKHNIDYKGFLRSTGFILQETTPAIMFSERAKLQAIKVTSILLYICIDRRENGN